MKRIKLCVIENLIRYCHIAMNRKQICKEIVLLYDECVNLNLETNNRIMTLTNPLIL